MPQDATPEVSNVDFEFLVKMAGSSVIMEPVSEETKPETLDDVYRAICTLKSNLESQKTAAMVQQTMMQAAMEMQNQFDPDGDKTESGIVIPTNKNIR